MSAIELQPAEAMRFLNNWDDVIEQLLAGETTAHELDTYLSRSRRSIKRVLKRLDEKGLVNCEKNSYWLTQLGRQIAWAHCDYTQRIETVTDAAPLLTRFPTAPMLPSEMIDGVEQTIAPSAAPDVPFGEIEASMEEASHVRGIAPHVERQYVDVFGHHISELGTKVELILDPDTRESTSTFYPEAWEAALESDNFTLWPVDEVPEFGLIIVDEDVAWIGIYPPAGSGLIGTLRNDTEAAVEWAIEMFECCKE